MRRIQSEVGKELIRKCYAERLSKKIHRIIIEKQIICLEQLIISQIVKEL